MALLRTETLLPEKLILDANDESWCTSFRRQRGRPRCSAPLADASREVGNSMRDGFDRSCSLVDESKKIRGHRSWTHKSKIQNQVKAGAEDLQVGLPLPALLASTCGCSGKHDLDLLNQVATHLHRNTILLTRLALQHDGLVE